MTARKDQKKPAEPLLNALTRAGIGGFPIEIWLATATAMAPAGVRYQTADAEALCRARPNQVSVHKTQEGKRYQLPAGADGAALPKPPAAVEDAIAAALIALLDKPASDPGVRRYLERCLPAQCADGTGAGIDALRARAAQPGIDLLLADALDRRATRLPSAQKVILRQESVTLYAAAGQRAKSAEVRGVLSGDLAAAGDLAGAIEEMRLAGADYQLAAMSDPFYLRFVAVVQLNLGRLYVKAGRRRDARAATKEAVRLFESIAARDHRFADEVRLARRQLKQLGWWGSLS